MDSQDDTTNSTANFGTAAESSNPQSHSEPQETESSANIEESKKKSKVWLHFVKTNIVDKAKCIHCGAMITCRTKHGGTTSAMLKHISACKLRVQEEGDGENDVKKLKQTTLLHQNEVDGVVGSKVPSYVAFSQLATRKALVEMIIMDELPFRFVEHKGFRRFMSIAQPRFDIPCRQTVARDCLEFYENEKGKLKKFFSNYEGSISLTTDCWTSIQNMSYMCLTAHYWRCTMAQMKGILGSVFDVTKRVEEVTTILLEGLFSLM